VLIILRAMLERCSCWSPRLLHPQRVSRLELASELLTKLGRHFKCRVFIALHTSPSRMTRNHHLHPILLDLNPEIAPLRPHNPNRLCARQQHTTSSNRPLNISSSTSTAAVPTYDHKAGKVIIFNGNNFPDWERTCEAA
jgi:hypothetical protein